MLNVALGTHELVVRHSCFGLVKTEFLCHVTSAQFVGDSVNPRFVDIRFAEACCCHVGRYLFDVNDVEATGQDLFDIFKEWMMWPHSACTTDAVFMNIRHDTHTTNICPACPNGSRQLQTFP